MSGPSGLKLGGSVEDMSPNILTKDFLVGVAKWKWAGLKWPSQVSERLMAWALAYRLRDGWA